MDPKPVVALVETSQLVILWQQILH